MLSYWNKLPDDVQKAVAAIILVLAGGTIGGCVGPQVCDPAPPPTVSPLPKASATPMICDPPPPPTRTATPSPRRTPTRPAPSATPTRVQTPMICDPPPPPTRSATPARTQTPIICDPPPRPSRTPSATPTPAAQAYGGPAASLPLAEIREVRIEWEGGLTFSASSSWPGARYRWFASGGELEEAAGVVHWRPPAQPGTYLIQVVADWGAAGIAVDALAMAVADDGTISWV